ncbi:hypothetical protein HWV62_30455 [Athelia sp. TMB]|nr:hypothetical protein HWV62_30455 [Athelia sp. TMB]
MPAIFKDHRGRLVNVDGLQVTTELSFLLATGMALGAYRMGIEQEIRAQSVDSPVSTHTSVTFDFSDGWRVKELPMGPTLRHASQRCQTDGECMERSSSEASPSPNPVQQNPCNDDICEVCLAKYVIASLDDCDCVAEREMTSPHSSILIADAALANSLRAWDVARKSRDDALYEDITLGQSI